jgi:DNA-binding transcriptional MerR regulator
MADGIDDAVSRGRRRKSDSAFRTISEVATELGLPQHVLRFWETQFSQIRPLKRGGGRRYYRPEDVALLRRVRTLLYEDGYTIRGVQRLLRENGGRPSAAPAPEQATPAGGTPPAEGPMPRGLDPDMRAELEALLRELEELRALLGRGEDG